MPNKELLRYAIDVSDRVFTPLMKNDLFWLNHLVDNPAAYDAYMMQLLDDWDIPDEEQIAIEYDIQKYCPDQKDL